MFSVDRGGNWFAYNSGIYGDWCVHLTFINSFLHRSWLWWLQDHPLAQGEPFRYPFLSHALTALIAWVAGGFQVPQSAETVIRTAWYTSVLALAFVPWLFWKGLEIIGLNWVQRALAIFIFTGNGGWGIFKLGLDPNKFPTNESSLNLKFSNFLIWQWLPQRSFLFALFHLALGIYFWRKKRHILSGLVLGLLIFSHVHSWIATGFLFWMLVLQSLKKIKWQPILKFSAAFAFSSLFGLAFEFRNRTGFSQPWNIFSPGWAQGHSSFFDFWWTNFGISIPLALCGVYFSKGLVKKLAISGLVLGLVACVIQFQPYDYDNLKIICYAYALLVPGIVTGVIVPLFNVTWKFSNKVATNTIGKYSGRFLAVTAIVLLTVSGYWDVTAFLNGAQKSHMFSPPDFAMAEAWVASIHDPDAVALTAPRPNHWLPALAGQPVVAGYAGWLWTWGIGWEKQTKLGRMLEDGSHDITAELLHAHKIRYVALDPNRLFYMTLGKSVMTSSNGVVIDIGE